ncbi:glycosyl hydrolase [Flavobacterium sp. AED]|uniref:glycosyl hydrolase n=1 Tax=Flavobacterium sp. AED TaxID=1423323 RepID=UPI00057DE545|nr:glycosyl hydrolase [Flavobacterium sp. AED]KIA86520.1 glycoside hydrolase [Flavobacterium sp. AED]MDI1306377.1 glycosyl hydrolase [bacterium]
MKKNSGLIAAFSLMLACSSGYAQNKSDSLLKEFATPPNSAKPRVWWHWMNGNISKDGIAKDLLWMNRIGIGGFMNFDAAMTTPQIVKKRLSYMTPEWKDAFQFTTKLADSLKLEMAIAGSPGWSESGGPWVPAKSGMKKLVWSEIRVKGGKKFTGVLPKAPTKTGAFQNIPFSEAMTIGDPVAEPVDYYEDISLMAYKLPDNEVNFIDLKPKVTSSGGNFTANQLTDGDLATTILLPATKNDESAWIQFAFEKPQTFKGITVVGGGDKGPFGLFGDKADTRSVEVSDDGVHFKKITFIPAGGLVQQTINFPATTAKYFRVTFKNPPPIFSFEAMMGSDAAPKPSPGTDVAEIVLHSTVKIDRFEEKAAFAAVTNIDVNGTPSTDGIALENVIDLSGKLNADGTLNWTPPAGNWKIVRFGFSLLGITNHPASPEATGFEVDKLDPVAIKAYFENYLDQYQNATGGLMGDKGGLQYIVTDSWEAGAQNWTKNLPAEFAKRRGYSLLPWMPALTGQVIKSSEASEKFLWDYRKTLSEMLSEYHYDQLTTLLHERGMKRYSESHESGRALIADGMEVKRNADIPMGAMWTPGSIGGDGKNYNVDIRESASVAHLYGQNLVAAESLTAIGNAWAFSPERLKPTADMELASGLNRFVIHTSVHQPSDEHVPGLGLGPFGQWFTRHETWAEQATAWTDYLSRSSYLLQQGKFVADVIYYYGEDNNITSLFGKKQPNIPAGYNYDFVNADALLNLLSVKNGQIVTPSGMHYKVLALDANSQQMTLKVANKISDLVKAGAIVVGPKPIGTPSLTDDLTTFNTVVNELWGADNTVKSIGSGKVYTGESIEKVLTALAVKPDFEYTKPQADTQLLYVHRELPEQELYWVNNRNARIEDLEATFRVAGKTVEIWHPETGKTEPASYSFADGRTKVALHLEPNDAVFVVFKDNTTTTAQILPAVSETKLAALEGNWNLSFQKERGAPSEITMDKLTSWTDNSDAGVKYFSGTGTYSKTIDAPKSWFKNQGQLWIDLGEVKNLAEVIVNGKSLGIVWKKPFRVDATGILKPGKNTLVIKVTNLWVNRLIGDVQPGVVKKITYTTMPFYKADAPLLPSGLLSTVTVLSVK